MDQVKFVEYRMLLETGCAASASLFVDGLQNTALLQIARVDTGREHAFSAYALYREGAMTFEASATLALAGVPPPSLGQALRNMLNDSDFLDVMLAPMKRQVDHHFRSLRR